VSEFVRRNRVDERRAFLRAAALSLPAVMCGLSATGAAALDAVLVVASMTALSWACASAPWWALAVLGGAGVALGGSWPAVFGAAALAGALWIGHRRAHLTDARIVVAALAMHSLAWSTSAVGPWGLAIVVVSAGVVVVAAIRRRPSRIRRAAWWSLGSVGLGAVLATGALALVGLSSRQAIDDSRAMARDALGALRAGDIDEATSRLEAAARSAQRASDRVDGVWTQAARVVPVVAQHRAALVTLTGESAAQLQRAASALGAVDLGSLRIVNGQIDISAVERFVPPIDEVTASVETLERSFDGVSSRWLVPQVREQLAVAKAEVEDQRELLVAARDLLRVAPRLLGAGGERRYLVLFTTPSEARGVGGFSGNFAELEVTDGEFTLGKFGRTSELDDALRGTGARCDPCAAELLDVYGDFGLATGVGGAVGDEVWKNITMPAHFPHVAAAARVLYDAAGMGRVDGVAVMDPYVMRRFLRYTGPVAADGVDGEVTADGILPFVLFEQYLAESNEQRIDALDGIGRAVIGALLAGSLPDPVTLATDLWPLVTERRLLVWTDDTVAQSALASIGLDGGLPVIDPSNDVAFGVSVNNAGANKIDAFLDVDVALDIEGSGTERRLLVEVTLTNSAPSAGLPNYVIGNPFGLPLGTNRYYLSFYSAVLPTAISRDGVTIGVGPATEAGWVVSRRFDHLLAGERTVYRLEFDMPPTFTGSIGDVVTFTQSLVRDRRDLGRLAPAAS
jgi:hypothetical protein